jgi:hypothetical protein
MASLAAKLLIKPAQSVVLFGAPAGFDLAPLPKGATTARDASRGRFDRVLLFARDQSALGRRAKRALEAAGPEGSVWIAYPKKTSGVATDLSRDAGWDTVVAAGFRGVSLISIDDVWSAMRVRRMGAAKVPAQETPAVIVNETDGSYEFRALLRGGEHGNVAYFEFPLPVLTTFGTRARVPVVGTLNGVAFRSSLSPMGDPLHLMPVNATLRAAAKCKPGDIVHVVLARDEAPRVVLMPADLERAITPTARAAWARLSFTSQHEYATWIEGAKKAETRARRVENAVAMLANGQKIK